MPFVRFCACMCVCVSRQDQCKNTLCVYLNMDTVMAAVCFAGLCPSCTAVLSRSVYVSRSLWLHLCVSVMFHHLRSKMQPNRAGHTQKRGLVDNSRLLVFQVCISCMGVQDHSQPCVSLDCPVLFRRHLATQDLARADQCREALRKAIPL